MCDAEVRAGDEDTCEAEGACCEIGESSHPESVTAPPNTLAGAEGAAVAGGVGILVYTHTYIFAEILVSMCVCVRVYKTSIYML